jgi:hypothetical protein
VSHRLVPRVWLPGPADPLQITSLADAFGLASATDELASGSRILVLLDRTSTVLAVLADPAPELLTLPGKAEGPGLVRPVSASLLLSRQDVQWGPPDDHDLRWFRSLRELHAGQDVRLLDWIQVDRDRDLFRSVASVVDGEDAWRCV